MLLPKLEITDASRKEFRLMSAWSVDTSIGKIVIPRGFVTDLASIPSFLFFWSWGAWNLAAIAHDFAYVYGFFWTEDGSRLIKTVVSKKEVDFVFLELCLRWKVNPITARLMFLAVRWFGRSKIFAN